MTEMTNKMHFQTACNPQRIFTLLWDQKILIADDKASDRMIFFADHRFIKFSFKLKSKNITCTNLKSKTNFCANY